MKTLLSLLLLIPSLSWGLGENIKNNKNAIKEKIQDKVEVARSNNNNPSVSSANKELIHQIKNNFKSIEDLEEALTSAVKEQGKEKLIEDIQTTIEKKVIVAENLYKKLNENDLNEIANLLIAIEVLHRTSTKKYQVCHDVGKFLKSVRYSPAQRISKKKLDTVYSKICG